MSATSSSCLDNTQVIQEFFFWPLAFGTSKKLVIRKRNTDNLFITIYDKSSVMTSLFGTLTLWRSYRPLSFLSPVLLLVIVVVSVTVVVVVGVIVVVVGVSLYSSGLLMATCRVASLKEVMFPLILFMKPTMNFQSTLSVVHQFRTHQGQLMETIVVCLNVVSFQSQSPELLLHPLIFSCSVSIPYHHGLKFHSMEYGGIDEHPRVCTFSIPLMLSSTTLESTSSKHNFIFFGTLANSNHLPPFLSNA
ncbi:hypothetical protein Tco_0415724 [Tanacetum coccineum]